MRIEKLFNIGVFHDYYRDGQSRDFEIIPTADTQIVIRNHRMMLKNVGSGIMLAANLNAAGQMVPPFNPQQKLRFWIKLNRPEVYSFTALPGKGPFLFSLASETDTAFTMTQWSEQRKDNFSIKNAQAKTIFPLTKRPIGGMDKSQFVVEGLGTRKVLAYDPKNATIELNTQDKQGAIFSVKYPIPAQENPGIFGLIEVSLKTDGTGAIVPDIDYQLNLQAASSIWKYYFVFPNPDSSITYSVVDEVPTAGITAINFDAGVNLTLQPDPSDATAQQLSQKYPETDIYKFSTIEAIAFRQAGRKFLRLKRKNVVLMEHLPVPAHSLQTETIITFI